MTGGPATPTALSILGLLRPHWNAMTLALVAVAGEAARLRRTLYHHIHRLSLAEHDETRTGDLIGRVTRDIDSIQDFVTTALLGIVSNALTLVGIIGVMRLATGCCSRWPGASWRAFGGQIP